MANPILLGKTGLDQYVTDSLKTLGTKYGITIPVRTEGWFALRKTVEDAAKQISVATNTKVLFDTASPTALAFSLAATIPNLIAGSAGPTLGTLTFSTTFQIGVSVSGTILGATPGSTITTNIAGITVDSSGRTYSGTPTGAAGVFAFTEVFGQVNNATLVNVAAAPGQTVDQQRTATFSKIMALTTNEQANSRHDAAPLALTPGTTTNAPSLPTSYTYQNNPGVFEAMGGAPLVTNNPAAFVIVQMDDAPNTGGGMNSFMPGGKYYWQFSTEWMTRVVNTRYIEIATIDTPLPGNPLRLWVNGKLAMAGKQPFSNNFGGGGIAYTKFDLGAVGNYDISLECNGAVRFVGFNVDAGATCVKQSRPNTGTILFLGDSYTSGASYTAVRGQDLMKTVGRYLGFHNVMTCGLSGSAMVTTTGVKKWDVSLGAGSSVYLDFVQPVIKPICDPDIVVISLGYNDNGSQGPTVAALQTLWTQVRADFPRALIVVMGMWGGVIQARATLQNRESGILTQFNTWNDPFSVMVRLQFSAGSSALNAVQYGQGYTGSPLYDGINDLILNGDRNHLNDGYNNDDGQWYVATKIRDAILTLMNSMPTTYNPSNSKVAYWPLSLKLAGGQPTAATLNSPFRFSLMSTGGAWAGALPGASTAIPVKTHTLVGGALPTGMALQSNQGHQTGTPTAAGTYNFTIRCADSIAGSTVDLPASITVA